MENAVLVDSCVFISLIRAQKDPAVELVERAETTDLATCGMVRLEVLRGVGGTRLRQRLESFMSVMRNVQTDNRLWEDATQLGWQLGRAGWNLPAQDIVIATCALRIDAAVLTYDKHFDHIPGLRVLRSLEELE